MSTNGLFGDDLKTPYNGFQTPYNRFFEKPDQDLDICQTTSSDWCSMEMA